MLDVKALLAKLLNSTYVVQNSGNISVPLPASDSVTVSKNVAITGFTPVGIVGVHASGTGASLGYLVGSWVSGNLAYVTLRNTTSTARNYTVTVDVLYKVGG